MPVDTETQTAAAAGSEGTTNTTTGTPAGAAPAQASGSPQAGTQGTTVTDPNAATRTGASTTGTTQTPDRSNWIPPHRLREETERRQAIEMQLAEAQRQVAALTNTQPQTPQQQQSEQVRNALFQMFPFLKKFADLDDEQLERVLSSPEHVESIRAAEQQQWQRHGDQQVGYIAEKVADGIGVEALDDDQRADLRDAFSHWLKTRARKEYTESAAQFGQDRAFSETVQRYERGDQKLLDEFVTRYTKNWVEPARRAGTARTVNRMRPVPNSGGRDTVTSSVQRPAAFKSLDERIEYAANLAKERGAVFGR